MAKVYLEDTELTNIGDAIRAKGGTTELLLPSEMPAAIDAIETGGKIQMEGDVTYICGYPGTYTCNWLVENISRMVKPDIGPITNARGMCYHMNCDWINSITFDLKPQVMSADQLFCETIMTVCPKLKGTIYFCPGMFSNSRWLESIPVESTAELTVGTGMNQYMNGMFNGALHLKDISGFTTLWKKSGAVIYQFPTNMYNGCYYLREFYVPNLEPPRSSSDSYLGNLFKYCASLENIEWQEDTLRDGSYDYQTLDLSTLGYFSFTPTEYYINNYKVAQPELEVTDLDSYNRLKDQPEWWTKDKNFSHLNHTNAVRIINNLPSYSISAPTIQLKFDGAMGSGYGDPISNLTDEEIAVATDKRWTVALV